MARVRLEKIGALIKRELSLIFQQNMYTLFSGIMVTVTQVRVSPDMGIAKVYLSFFPTEKKEPAMAEVKSRTVYIRKLLGNTVSQQIRKIPELHFYIDDSLDYAAEIDRLLKKK